MLDYFNDWIRAEPFTGVLLMVAAIGLFGVTFKPGGTPVTFWLWTRRFVEAVFGPVLLLGLLIACYEVLDKNVETSNSMHSFLKETERRSVRSVWGDSLWQKELAVDQFVEVETQDKVAGQDSTPPVFSESAKQRQPLAQNSITGFRGTVEITLSEPEKRELGYELYNTYLVKARYGYQVTNVSDSETEAEFSFSLPLGTILYEDFRVVMDGQDLASQLHYSPTNLVSWKSRMLPRQQSQITVTYTSRGMDSFYYQIPTQREIRDFELTLIVNSRAFYVMVEPESDVLHPEYIPTEDQKGALLRWKLDRTVMVAQMGVAMFQPERPYAPYAKVHYLLEYGPKALVLLGVTLILTLLIFGRPVRFLDFAFLVGGYSAQFFFIAGVSDYFVGLWGVWSLGAILTSILAFFLFHRYSPILLRVLLYALGVVFVMYPLASLLIEVTQRNMVDNVLQVGIIIYLFGLMLYTRIRSQQKSSPGGSQC